MRMRTRAHPPSTVRDAETCSAAVCSCRQVGQPVPANTFISLVHVNTCTALSTGTAVVKNKYGGEYEVTTFTATPITKGAWGKRNGSMLGAGNHWAFTTSDVAAAAPPAAES